MGFSLLNKIVDWFNISQSFWVTFYYPKKKWHGKSDLSFDFQSIILQCNKVQIKVKVWIMQAANETRQSFNNFIFLNTACRKKTKYLTAAKFLF